jgi:hypothetical protein
LQADGAYAVTVKHTDSGCLWFGTADDQMQQQKRLLEMNALAAGTITPLQSGPI